MTEDMRELLERRLEEEGMPARVPISVAELHRRLLPYPMCRDRLGFASKAEYDVDLLRLIVDDNTLQVPESALVEAAQKELRSPEPGLAVLQRFAASEVMLRSAVIKRPGREAPKEDAADRSDGEDEGPLETGPPIADLETGRGRGDFIPGLDDPLLVPQDESADALGRKRAQASATPRSEGSSSSDPAAGRCRSCREPLPDRAGVRYCPRCGADQERWPCPSCGQDVERGWSYCALCGKMIPN
jgi:hypothetical protein